MLQVGVMVARRGGGVATVLVDLIQAPDANDRCVALMDVLSAKEKGKISVCGFLKEQNQF